LDKDRWVFWWADGIYSGLRGEGQRLCALVLVGVIERGQKRFLRIEDGVRESSQSWREVLLNLKERGIHVAPQAALGDGALGFWVAVEEIFPTTRKQRCWVHKTANVLNYLRKSVQAKAKNGLHEMAQTRKDAEKAFGRFLDTYRAKYPKATDCLAKDCEPLLAFYNFPAEHWLHLRIANPIESTFATIRHRTDRAKGCVTRDTILSLKRRRRIRGFEHLAKVITEVKLKDDIKVTELAKEAA
jgi:transposase-like protein